MTEEVAKLRKQVRTLEAELFYKEKELLRVYRELERYRRKCALLALKNREPKQADEIAMKVVELLKLSAVEVSATVSPVQPEEPTVEDAKEDAPPSPVKPKVRKTPLNRLLKGELPFNKEEKVEVPVHLFKDLVEEKKPVEDKKSPGKRGRAAYMEPYAPVKYQAVSYTPTHLQPATITPLYESLQHKEGASVKWRESFQLLKLLYLSQDTFSKENVAVLQETLNGERPAPVATFLVQEVSEAADVLHFGDAVELAFAAVINSMGKDTSWDQTFLKALKALATDATQQRVFQGLKRKMQVSMSVGDSGNVLSFIVTLHTLFCSAFGYLDSHRDLMVFLLCRGNLVVANLTHSLWPNASGLFSLKVLPEVLAGRPESLWQEVAVMVSVSSHSNFTDIYQVVKLLFMTSKPEDAYQLYANHLWSVFAASFYDSCARKIILKGLGLLIRALERAGKGSIVIPTLVKSLEEILLDVSNKSECHIGFSASEQTEAAHSLRKAGKTSEALEQWLHKHS